MSSHTKRLDNGSDIADVQASVSSVDALQSDVNTNSDNLLTEAQTRQSADAALESAISAETTQRQTEDSSLQSSFLDVQSAVSTEATNRSNADTILQQNIDAEATNRTNADDSLQTQITSARGQIASTWDSEATYAEGDMVAYNNTYYRSLNDANTNLPPPQGFYADGMSTDTPYRVSTTGATMEVGNHFSVLSAGTCTAIRYFRNSGNTATAVNLWESTDLGGGSYTHSLLATKSGIATSPYEEWHTITLDTPISLQTSKLYTVSFSSGINANIYSVAAGSEDAWNSDFFVPWYVGGGSTYAGGTAVAGSFPGSLTAPLFVTPIVEFGWTETTVAEQIGTVAAEVATNTTTLNAATASATNNTLALRDGSGACNFEALSASSITLATTGGTATALNYYEEATLSATVSGLWGTPKSFDIPLTRIGRTVFMTLNTSWYTDVDTSQTVEITSIPSRFLPTSNKYGLLQIVDQGVFATGSWLLDVETTPGSPIFRISANNDGGWFTTGASNTGWVGATPTWCVV
jgi:hypothetical protein